jgi:hypothetical protein
MSDRSWNVLEEAGILVVTRTNRSQRQYQIVQIDDLRCHAVPGHERILACPDLYLTPRSAPQALLAIERAQQHNGVLDVWAHTEEVTSPEQIGAWQQVVAYAAQQQQAGRVWIAPLAEIAERQQDIALVTIDMSASGHSANPDQPLVFTISSRAPHDLDRLTLRLPFATRRVIVSGSGDASRAPDHELILDLAAGATLEVQAWPA